MHQYFLWVCTAVMLHVLSSEIEKSNHLMMTMMTMMMMMMTMME